jgi:protein disulfide-isomerase A1
MKCSTICAAFFAAVVAASSDVVQLKTDTFKEFVQDNDLVLAECKSLLLYTSPNIQIRY